jgi:hypothetical protein
MTSCFFRQNIEIPQALQKTIGWLVSPTFVPSWYNTYRSNNQTILLLENPCIIMFGLVCTPTTIYCLNLVSTRALTTDLACANHGNVQYDPSYIAVFRVLSPGNVCQWWSYDWANLLWKRRIFLVAVKPCIKRVCKKRLHVPNTHTVLTVRSSWQLWVIIETNRATDSIFFRMAGRAVREGPFTPNKSTISRFRDPFAVGRSNLHAAHHLHFLYHFINKIFFLISRTFIIPVKLFFHFLKQREESPIPWLL